MSVYKELFKFAEDIENRSNRIYPDACDYGVIIEDHKDNKDINQLRYLIEAYDGKVHTDSYGTGLTQTITITGIDEWQTKREVTFTFTYVFTKGKKDPNYLYVQS